MTQTLLSVENLSKSYPQTRGSVVSGVDFSVNAGEIFALIGPSGCGKTTTLRMIAGFEAPDSGSIRLDGREVSALPPEKRGIGIVFQDYALFPHLTVEQNVAFSARDASKAARRALAAKYLGMVGLTGFEDRYPDQLSGGQQQRVALARSFAAQPRLILLDEPFSNLDAALRASARREIRAILKATGVSVVFVTHDQEEALSFADTLAVMRGGKIEQMGSPEAVYAHPRTAFVANFLGRTNLIPARASGGEAETAFGPVPLASEARGDVMLSLRPEQLLLEASADGAATVISRDFKGHDMTYWVRLGEAEYQVDTMFGPLVTPGQKVQLKPRSSAVVLQA